MSEDLAPNEVVVTAYIELRERVVALVRSLPEDRGDVMIPACPDWTARQLVAHMVGVPEDIITGNMDGVTTRVWTDAQVTRHEGKSLQALADSYEETGQVFDDVLPRISEPVNSQMVMDAVTHEHDLREALGEQGARDSAAVDVALAWLRYAFGARFSTLLADPFTVNGVDSYELLRSLTGRRSTAEMDALGLDGSGIAAILVGTPLGPGD